MMALADAYVPMPGPYDGPYPYTVDGIGWAYGGVGLSNYSEDILIYFSAPVSYFEFSTVFPSGAVNPGVSTNLQYTNVTWSDPVYSFMGPTATVRATAPNISYVSIGLGESPYSESTLYNAGVVFTNINQPPSTGISQTGDAPEPATLTLAVLALVAMAIGRRRWTRTHMAPIYARYSSPLRRIPPPPDQI
jgi:hypothetical protein